MSIRALVLALVASTTMVAGAQTPAATDSIVPTLPPRVPLPAEAATANVTRFSFIVYGDTRGRHDGKEIQAEHELVVESMLGTIKKAATTPDAIRFVLQSGDAVQNGAIAAQLRVSYVPLINRLTQEGGVPYFLAVGNHDVGSGDNVESRREEGLRNYLRANSRLIPPDGSPRRLNGYPTYAFGYGNSFFIAIDSDIPEDSTQFRWVKSQLDGLDRHRYVNVAVFFHHPPFSSGGHGGAKVEHEAATIRSMWMGLFHQYHVRMLLTGHEHLYEHWAERYKDASGPHRLDEIVTGGGGAPLTTYTGEPDLHSYVAANQALGIRFEHLAKPSSEPGANPFHYVVVHVDGDDIRLEVIGVDWGKNFAPYRSSGVSLADPKP